MAITVREFDPQTDCKTVEEVERKCEVGPSGKLSLFTDLLGDPICRVRNSPSYLMLVAEMGSEENEEKEIVGMIRGCIKTVTCGKKLARNGKNMMFDPLKPVPVLTKLAYVLGLRVSPSHRRLGIGFMLVKKMEDWFSINGAEYSYMATDNDNIASVELFTGKCGYTKFRTPSILVNPVFAHKIRIPNKITIIELSILDAETLYRLRFSTTEFFPRDIDSVLRNKLNLGTFIALPKGEYSPETWPGSANFLAEPPESWAVMSVWNSQEVFKLELRGASRVQKGLAKTTRALDRVLPWLQIPSVPELFRPFGFHFLYGLGGEGPRAAKLVKALCGHAHNIARKGGCSVVATEISCHDPLKVGIPHWKKLSCPEDLWCIKRLDEDYSDGSVGDWTKSPPDLSVFIDPRDI